MPIIVKPNPIKGKNALLCFKQKGILNFNNAEVHFSYIPDREIVEQNHFNLFLKETEVKEGTLENFANALVERFYHEALPFFAKLDIVIHHKNSGEVQRLQIVEKQPDYKMPEEIRHLV